MLTDKGYTGVGIGVHRPIKRRAGGFTLHEDNRRYNQLLTALRAPTECAHALLGRRRALDRVTICPQRITTVAAAALVLTPMQRGRC